MQRLFILEPSIPCHEKKGIPSKKYKLPHAVNMKRELRSPMFLNNTYLTLYLRTPNAIHQITVDDNITSALDIITWLSYYIFVPPPFIQLYHRRQLWKCCEYLDVFLKKTHTNSNKIIIQYKIIDFPSNPWWSTHHIQIKGFSKQKSLTFEIFPHSHDVDCKYVDKQSFNIIHSTSKYTTSINWKFYLVKGCACPSSISLKNIILRNEYGYVVPLNMSYNVDKEKMVNVKLVLRKSLSQGKYFLILNPSHLKSNEKIFIYRTVKCIVFPMTIFKLVVA